MNILTHLKDRANELSRIIGALGKVVFGGLLIVLVFVLPGLIKLFGGLFVACLRFTWEWGTCWIAICLELLNKIF